MDRVAGTRIRHRVSVSVSAAKGGPPAMTPVTLTPDTLTEMA